MKQPVYPYHRLALAPLLPGARADDLTHSLGCLPQTGIQEFVDFLLQHQLGPLWHAALGTMEPGPAPPVPELQRKLKPVRLKAAAEYMIQQQGMTTAVGLLTEANIVYAVIKGADSRERYYASPSLRPAVDLDILVSPEQRRKAIHAFLRAGYSLHGSAETASHECALIKGQHVVDLHWEILRPGRTRQPMASSLLLDRVNYGQYWSLAPMGQLFILLVHPVFTKYTTAPQAWLVRVLDLAYLLQQEPGAIMPAVELIRAQGVATAAWLSARWLQMHGAAPGLNELCELLAPGRLRRQYLQAWLDHDYASKAGSNSLVTKIGLTLPVHDTTKDMARAIRAILRGRRDGPTLLSALQADIP